MVQYMNLTRLSGKKTIFSRKKWMLFVSFALERNKNKNLFTCVVYSIHVYESLERTSVHCVIPSQYCFMDVFAHSVLRHNIIYCWIYFVYSSDGSILMISLRNEKKRNNTQSITYKANSIIVCALWRHHFACNSMRPIFF